MTCASLDDERDHVDLRTEPCAADPRVQALLEQYSWSHAANLRYKIYAGQSSLGRTAVVVTAYTEAGEKIVLVRGKSAAVAKGNVEAKAAAALAAPTAAEKDPNEWMSEFQDWLRRMRRRRGR
jgi:hypothetical protein